MSYYFSMYYKKVSSLEEGIKVLNAFIKEYCERENIKKVVEDNSFYISNECERAKLKVSSENSNFYHFSKYLFQQLLTFKAMYYPKFNLLGLCFYDCTGTIDKYFDGQIEFQNSCDQDYDFETWDILGDYFTHKANEFKKMPLEELLKLDDCLKEYIVDEGEEDLDDRIEYSRKQLMYDFVFYETLDLDSWLWEHESKEGIFIPLDLFVPVVDDPDLARTMCIHFIEIYEKAKNGEL